MILSSTKAEYIALTLAAKKATWLRLLFTELDLLQPDKQYALIKISEQNTYAQAIYHDLDLDNACGEKEELATSITISLKGDNQESIALAHNPVFHARTKYIDI